MLQVPTKGVSRPYAGDGMTASARGATPDDLPMMVLDVLRHDIEQIPSILNLLNDTEDIGWRDVWPEDFKESDVVEALRALVRDGSVDVYVEDPEAGELVPSASPMEFERALDDSWFLLTDAGRERWETWDAPIDAGHTLGGASEERTERISQLLRDVAQSCARDQETRRRALRVNGWSAACQRRQDPSLPAETPHVSRHHTKAR